MVSTMTSGELIEELKRLDPRDKVAIRIEDKAGRTAITDIIKLERCPSTYGFHAVIAAAPIIPEDME